MSKRTAVVLAGLVCFLVGWMVGQQLPFVQAQETKPPVWKHGLDLKARMGGQTEFDKARKYGVEVFVDPNNGNTIYITETGSIAVVPSK